MRVASVSGVSCKWNSRVVSWREELRPSVSGAQGNSWAKTRFLEVERERCPQQTCVGEEERSIDIY